MPEAHTLLAACGLFVDMYGFVLIPQPPVAIEVVPCKGLGYGGCGRPTLNGRSCRSCHADYLADPDAFK